MRFSIPNNDRQQTANTISDDFVAALVAILSFAPAALREQLRERYHFAPGCQGCEIATHGKRYHRHQLPRYHPRLGRKKRATTRLWSSLWAGSGSFQFLADMFDAVFLAGPLIWVNADALVLRDNTNMVGVLYSTLKPFLFPGHLADIRAGRVPAPVHVRIKPTNVCNHSCWFCAYRSDAVSLGSGMDARDRIPREKMLEIVDDLVEMGVAAVTFSGGGEPLIYPYIVETVNRLAAGGVRIGALTNGSMLKGKVADAFIRNGTWLRVSIDGWDGPSYARSRNVDVDEFDKVIGNLAAFAASGSPCALGASVIIDGTNAPHLFDLCQRLKGAGVGHVKLSPCIVRDSGIENDAYHAGFAPTVHAAIERIRKIEDRHFRVNDHYHALGDRFNRPERRCLMAYLLTIIGADLAVYTCQDKAYTPRGALGSIRERRFRDFWFSGENARSLAAIDPSIACRHHCVASAKNEHLNEYLALDPDHAMFV